MKTDAKKVIQMIVDYHLDRIYDMWNGKGWKRNEDGTTTFRGLLFDLQLEGHGKTESGDIQYYYDACYMLFCRRTTVFWVRAVDKEGNKVDWRDIEPSTWINTSNHDSCWRSDGFHELDEQYYKMLELLEKKGLKDVEVELEFGVLGDSYPKIVDITLRSKPDCGYELVNVKEIEEG